MTNNPFTHATKTKAKLRMALMGASGSGKTWTALGIASAFGKVALIDTEYSASKYGDHFTFDVLELTSFHPTKYIEALKAAAANGYDVVVIDSLSHAWSGAGGILEIVDQGASKSQGNKFAGWRDATPLHNDLISAIKSAPLHVIVTMRSKMEYVLESVNGKQVPRKVGMAPIQRDGMEYEFDVVAEMDMSNTLVVTKTRIPELADHVVAKPTRAYGETLLKWLSEGVEAPPAPVRVVEPEVEPNTVRGAGIQKPTPPLAAQNAPAPLAAPATGISQDAAPNVYAVTALVVGQTDTARTYALKLKSGAFVQVSDMGVFEGMYVVDTLVVQLRRGTYPVAWQVEADKSGDTWTIIRINSGVEVVEGETA